MDTLAERLGYRPDDRIVIISANMLGWCHAANEGVYASLRTGLATSATLMVPCPWARHAAAQYRGEDLGVQLTLNAEHDGYRWGPITQSPSLFDGDGGFPRTVADVWEHADLDEVRRECRAQVERAVLWGFDISHLSSHLGALQMRPEFFDVYLDLGIEFGLPLRLDGHGAERVAGFPFRELAANEGICSPDHVQLVRDGRRGIERALFNLEPGVTELLVHPALDTPELRALEPAWATRVDQLDLLTRDHMLRTMLERSGAKLIGYREVRSAQQRG